MAKRTHKKTGTRKESSITARVGAQYEAYPYPARNPYDEARRLLTGSPSHLLEINHYVFAGRRDFTKPFRALVAGGGTGDAVVMLAQQLNDAGCSAEIVYLDVSTEARRIAEARLKERRLKGVRFETISLTEVAGLGVGPFDYIDCCGVLHHLEDPAEGLAALASVLAEDGGIGAMVYGALGRTGVYAAQDLLSRLLPTDAAPARRVAEARKIVEALPPTNWLKRNPFVADYLKGGDAGFHDLLLHARDRAFTVPEVADLVDRAGLRIAAFVAPVRYDPDRWLSDPKIRAMTAGLDATTRAAVAELVSGSIAKHIFYVVLKARRNVPVAMPGSGDAVPVLWEAEAIRQEAKPGGMLSATMSGVRLSFPLPPLAPAMLSRIDGVRSLDDLFAEIAQTNPGLARDVFDHQFHALYGVLNGLGKLYLAWPRSPFAKAG